MQLDECSRHGHVPAWGFEARVNNAQRLLHVRASAIGSIFDAATQAVNEMACVKNHAILADLGLRLDEPLPHRRVVDCTAIARFSRKKSSAVPAPFPAFEQGLDLNPGDLVADHMQVGRRQRSDPSLPISVRMTRTVNSLYRSTCPPTSGQSWFGLCWELRSASGISGMYCSNNSQKDRVSLAHATVAMPPIDHPIVRSTPADDRLKDCRSLAALTSIDR